MLSKTKGTKFSELPAHISITLDMIQALRSSYDDLFNGYQNLDFSRSRNGSLCGQFILRAKRNILLATPSMQGHFSYATHMSYERGKKGHQWIFNFLNDLLATIELQGKYKTIRIQEKMHHEVFCGSYIVLNDVRVYARTMGDHANLLSVFEEKYNTEILHITPIGTKYLPNEDSEFIGDEDDREPYMEYVLFVPIT
jgi:hypothetical protein